MFMDDIYELGRANLDKFAAEWDKRIDAVKPDDTALLVYTSGTTGRSKGAMLSHANLAANAQQVDAIDPFERTEPDIIMGALPLFHVFANTCPSPILRAQRWMAEKLVFHNLKVMLGLDRARIMFTGAAPVSPDLIRWYRAIGLDLYELYGQTECYGITSSNRDGANRLGSIGQAVPHVEMKIAEDGEILYRGPHIFKGYLNQPEKTAETVIDGWLHSGDVGSVDNEGYYKITDRKKDIIITAGGKNITPSEIENQLKFSPYISDAVIIGDKRKYLTCLIMIDHENVLQYAQDLNVPFTDYASLCAREEVIDLINQEVEKVNQNFARVETVKKFSIIDKELTADDEELTATMKLKRSKVAETYKELIDAMY